MFFFCKNLLLKSLFLRLFSSWHMFWKSNDFLTKPSVELGVLLLLGWLRAWQLLFVTFKCVWNFILYPARRMSSFRTWVSQWKYSLSQAQVSVFGNIDDIIVESVCVCVFWEIFSCQPQKVVKINWISVSCSEDCHSSVLELVIFPSVWWIKIAWVHVDIDYPEINIKWNFNLDGVSNVRACAYWIDA